MVRQVYADRVVVPQPQPQAPQGRGRGMAMLTRGMMGGGPGQRQPQQDPSKRIAIGVNTRTNTLVIAAVNPMFEEVKQLVRELDAASAEQDDAVQVVTLHRTSAIAVEQALAAYGGDAVQDYTLATNSATSGLPAQIQRLRRGPLKGTVGRMADNGRWVITECRAAVHRPTKASAASADRATRRGANPDNRERIPCPANNASLVHGNHTNPQAKGGVPGPGP